MKLSVVCLILILGVVFVAFGANPRPTEFEPRFMAYCLDGDGPISDWLASRYDAFLLGQDHELQFRNHRWEIWVNKGGSTLREPVCGRVTEGDRPNTARVENTCNKCVRFSVVRQNADGTVNSREFNIKAKRNRQFRKPPNATMGLSAEGDCT